MTIRKPTFETVLGSAIGAGLALITVSDTVAGMIVRAVVPLYLYWSGFVSSETVHAVAAWHLF